uniref:Putative ovule protein n=1 Tax=Solanum chacoense TaxID=4108 RepID=A0A0V0H7W3_SOLCH
MLSLGPLFVLLHKYFISNLFSFGIIIMYHHGDVFRNADLFINENTLFMSYSTCDRAHDSIHVFIANHSRKVINPELSLVF